MIKRYKTKLNSYITHTATFAKGNSRYGWVPASYFKEQHAHADRIHVSNISQIFNYLVYYFLHSIFHYFSHPLYNKTQLIKTQGTAHLSFQDDWVYRCASDNKTIKDYTT